MVSIAEGWRRVGKSLRMMELIQELRVKECDSVALFHDNPDFDGPNCVIECSGFWTDLDFRRFEGASLLDCLEKATQAKRNAC